MPRSKGHLARGFAKEDVYYLVNSHSEESASFTAVMLFKRHQPKDKFIAAVKLKNYKPKICIVIAFDRTTIQQQQANFCRGLFANSLQSTRPSV